jgi:hypothetical protein
MAMTLYCSSKIDISASFIEPAEEPRGLTAVKVCVLFHGVGCGKFPISVWLGAQGTGVQFTRFLDRCTTSRTRHG